MQQSHTIRRVQCEPRRCASVAVGDVILYLPVFIYFFVASLRPRKFWLREGEKPDVRPCLSIGPAPAYLDCASACLYWWPGRKMGMGEGISAGEAQEVAGKLESGPGPAPSKAPPPP